VPLKIPREDFSAPAHTKAPGFQFRVSRLPAIATVAAIPAAPATASMTSAPATAASAMAAASAAISAATAGTTSAALCLGTCFVYYKVSPAKILTVQRIYRAIRVFVIGHFNERETARLARKPVANQVNPGGSHADLREPLVKLLLRRGKRKISDIKLLHLVLLLSGT
jgi:hypothetical protein